MMRAVIATVCRTDCTFLSLGSKKKRKKERKEKHKPSKIRNLESILSTNENDIEIKHVAYANLLLIVASPFLL